MCNSKCIKSPACTNLITNLGFTNVSTGIWFKKRITLQENYKGNCSSKLQRCGIPKKGIAHKASILLQGSKGKEL
jgi:hypothetical protein